MIPFSSSFIIYVLDFAVIVRIFLCLILYFNFYSWESIIFSILTLMFFSFWPCSAIIFCNASGLCYYAPYANLIYISFLFSLSWSSFLFWILGGGDDTYTISGFFFFAIGLFKILMTFGLLMRVVTLFLKKVSRTSMYEFILSTPL